jgi:hypothetical protein
MSRIFKQKWELNFYNLLDSLIWIWAKFLDLNFPVKVQNSQKNVNKKSKIDSNYFS